MFASPRVVGTKVVRVYGGERVVCGVTPVGEGVCGVSDFDANGVRVIDSARNVAGAYGSGRWCASLLRGGVRCGSIETLIGPATPGTRPAGLPDTTRFVEAIAGYASCARAESGVVWCWGSPILGELGRGSGIDTVAAPVAGGERFRSLVTGERVWCGIVTDGGVRCWGDGRVAILGDTTKLDRCISGDGGRFPCAKTPRRIVLPGPARQLAVAASGSCALLGDGRVVCWGSRFHQAVAPVGGLPADVAEIAVGGTHGCARTGGGELWCWSLSGIDRIPERIATP